MKQNNIYLFILCPPASGSTALWKLVSSSNHVSNFEDEGHRIGGLRDIMFSQDRWKPDKQIPWAYVKEIWEKHWDLNKKVLIEKSPPNLIRAKAIESHFPNAYFIVTYRNPYAFCEGMKRRHQKGKSYQQIAENWVNMMQHQKENIAELNRCIHFSYESFTSELDEVLKKIISFIPYLDDIKTGAELKVFEKKSEVANFNQQQIQRLSLPSIKEINTVLRKHQELLSFFGYKFIEPQWLNRVAFSIQNFKKQVEAKIFD